MTATDLREEPKMHQENLCAKLVRFANKKIYYSDQYIYLDKSEFGYVWHNIGLFIFLHALYLRGLYGILTLESDFFKCVPVIFLYYFFSGIGITAGAHRLYAHRSFKASLPLRIFLIFGHIVAGQNNMVVWCRDHRVHHKFSDTDADPHNTNRGFFFAHIGWLICKKHPDVTVKGSKIDISDLRRDKLVAFQETYYYPLYFLINLVIPISICTYCGASMWSAFLYAYMTRYASTLHSTWFVNSAAHMFGEKPFNESIRPVENSYVSFFALGEGYHNYHHSFPYDYTTSEFGKINFTKHFINFMARFGLAYDMKRASKFVIDARKAKKQSSFYKVPEENETIEYDLISNETNKVDNRNNSNISENDKSSKNTEIYSTTSKSSIEQIDEIEPIELKKSKNDFLNNNLISESFLKQNSHSQER